MDMITNTMDLTTFPAKNKYAPLLFQLHFSIGLLALSLLALPGVPANIGIALLALTLLRLPTTIKTLSILFREPLFLLLIAWWSFALLSISWSDNPEKNLLANPYLLLIIPALYPLLQESKNAILALGLGVAIHTGIQGLMWLGVMDGIRYAPRTLSGGLHWYPLFTALWSTVILLLLLGLLLTAKSKRDIRFSFLLLLPIPLSLLLAGNRTIFILLPIALIILAVKLFLFLPSKRKRIQAIAVCALIVLVGIGVLVLPGTSPSRRISAIFKQVYYTTEIGQPEKPSAPNQVMRDIRKRRVDRYVNSYGLRYVWWRGGFEIWKGSPWIGYGGGSTFKQFARIEAKMPTELGADVEGFITPEPHSTMLATAIEQGLVGIALMFAFASLGLLRSIQCVRNSPSLIGLSAAWFTVIVFSFAHTIQFSTYASTLIIILTTLTLGLTQKTQKAS